MKIYQYPRTRSLMQRATKVIPCGIYGHFGPAPYVPREHYPCFAERASGSRFWDVDGNEFIDYMCAYGPVILGYAHPRVDEAYRKQMEEADAASLASARMVELAELLVDLVPVADWAFFAKNGADVTNYAVMISRAATGRKKILVYHGGYHGTSPWMQGVGHHGTIAEDHQHVIRIRWNDVDALRQAVSRHEGQIAALISSPYHHPVLADSELPADGYWAQAEQILKRAGIVLICDDIRCGFRLHLSGSNEKYGFCPDLICFSKAIANGYALSALVGCDALKREAARVFHTGSFWYTAGALAAAIACIKELKAIDAPAVLRAQGRKLLDGMVQLAADAGLNLLVSGEPAMPSLRLANDPSLMLHQRFCGECTRRGAFFASHHNWFLSTAHSDDDVQRTLDIVAESLKAIKTPSDGPGLAQP